MISRIPARPRCRRYKAALRFGVPDKPTRAWFTFKTIFNTSAQETVQNCSHLARWKPDHVPTDISVAPNLLGRRHSRHPLDSVALKLTTLRSSSLTGSAAYW